MTPPRHPGHSHRLPRSLLSMVAVCIIGLLAAAILTFDYARTVNQRISRLEQYVQDRGEYRDQEQQRLEEQIRRNDCDLLSQLPAGQLLDRLRTRYHCGPGLPTAPRSANAG